MNALVPAPAIDDPADWLPTALIADILGVGQRHVLKRAEREGWRRADREWPADPSGTWRVRSGRGGGIEYRLKILPPEVQARAFADRMPPAKIGPSGDELWTTFERMPESKRAAARERLAALDAVRLIVEAGGRHETAMATVAADRGLSVSTLFAWKALLRGKPRGDWLPALAPRHVGRLPDAPIAPELWDAFKADYLRLEAPAAAACHQRLKVLAQKLGLALPAIATLKRRIERELSPGAIMAARDGAERLKRSYPAQERDRSHFAAMEAVNADGHKVDVFARFPATAWRDEFVTRPILLAVQDLMSGKIVAWRVGPSESAALVRLALADMAERWGVPEQAWLDNGRGFASKWITGQQPTRNRYKIKEEDPAGILTLLGVRVHWATPYSGQSKPIERAFRDLCESIAKHPALAGAYTGNSPDAKPENYGSRAVPLELFLEVVRAEIDAHNARPGRTSLVCAGRSFDQAFEASYRARPPRRVGEAYRRMLLLAAEGVTVAREDGAIRLFGNRYWDRALHRFAGQKVVGRFDPDDLSKPLEVYGLDGRFIVSAACFERVGFDNVEAAKAHAKARRDFMRAERAQLAAATRMTAAKYGAVLLAAAPSMPLLEAPEAPEQPEPRIVTLRRIGGRRNGRRDEPSAETDAETIGPKDRARLFSEGIALLQARREQGL